MGKALKNSDPHAQLGCRTHTTKPQNKMKADFVSGVDEDEALGLLRQDVAAKERAV
jgi:hypothetical protein